MEKVPGRLGRPRSEQARAAVLHAVDDLLLEVGYSALTMKGIAERAHVGRQTVYRWWSTKAEVLFEASVIDAEQELAIRTTGVLRDDVTSYLDGLVRFLTTSPAGAAYRALLGEAQHDPAVAHLLASKDLLGDSARAVVEAALSEHLHAAAIGQATALLIGPTFFWVVSGRDAARLVTEDMVDAFLTGLSGWEPPART